MKKCFSQFIERFRWDDHNAYVLSQLQRECMRCQYFKKCYAVSLGKTIEHILFQLEQLHAISDEHDNGDLE